MEQFQHIKLRATQENSTSWLQWLAARVLTRFCNGLFIVAWKFFFAWVPLIFGRWWRRLFLSLVLKKCGKKLDVSTGVHIEYPWRISMGNHVWIGIGCHIEGMGGITIGDNVMIALQSVLQSAGHEFDTFSPIRTQAIVCEPITIQNGVWLGARTMVRHGVTIGENVVTGMGSVVVKDIPCNTIVGGVPAKPIGIRRKGNDSLQDDSERVAS